MQPKPEPFPVEGAPKSELWLRVRAADTGHHSGAGLGINNVYHGIAC